MDKKIDQEEEYRTPLINTQHREDPNEMNEPTLEQSARKSLTVDPKDRLDQLFN